MRPGTVAPEKLPNDKHFWLKSGLGALDWKPADLRDTEYSLIVMNPAGQPGVRYDEEKTGYGWKTELFIEAGNIVPPLKCQMERPPM